MSLSDVFSACIAEYTYWRGHAGRSDASNYAGQGYQPSGSAQQTEGGQGYAYGNTGYQSGFDYGSSAPQEDPYARRRQASPLMFLFRSDVICTVVIVDG